MEISRERLNNGRFTARFSPIPLINNDGFALLGNKSEGAQMYSGGLDNEAVTSGSSLAGSSKPPLSGRSS